MSTTYLEVTTVPEWTLGDRLRKARQAAHMEQAELAAHIGVSRGSIVNYEKDYTHPNRPVVLSIALATGVPIEWLYGADGCPQCGDARSRCFCASALVSAQLSFDDAA